jgi:CHAT domain-containing protein/tetratricopeptide (TPR) repeat protein
MHVSTASARSSARNALLAFFIMHVALISPSARQNDASPRTVAPAASVEIALNPGATHSYSLDLTVEQYVSLAVLQQGIDVAVVVRAPDGSPLVEVDGPTGKYGTERVRIIAAAAGAYRIDVRSLEKAAPAGRYRLDVGEVRVADADDRRRVEAQAAYLAAVQLRIRGTADALRQSLGRYEEAARLWSTVGEVAEEGAALNDLGYAYRLLSDYPVARAHYLRALDLRRQAADRPGEAQTLTNLGALSYLLGENQQALDSYTPALVLRRAESNFQEEALLLSNMGEVYALWSDHQRALEHFRQALPAQRRVGDRLRESLTLSNIGLVYSNTGQHREALPFFEDALAAARTSGNRRVEARILVNQGGAFRELGEAASALASYEQALALQRAGGDRLGESETLNAIGVLLMRSGDEEKALEQYRRALTLQQAVGSRRNQAATLNNIASVLVRRGVLDEALTGFTESLSLRRAVQDRRGEAESLFGIARVHRQRRQLPEALAAAESALDIVESLRTKLVGLEMRASAFATSLDMYDLVAATLMDLHATSPDAGYAARAFHVTERARARALLDALVETQGGVRGGISGALRSRERDLQDRINSRAERQIQLLSGNHTPDEAERANREMAALLTDRRELDAEIRASSPRYAELTQPRPLDAETVRRQVLDDDTLLLEYALGAERSYLWVLSRGSMTTQVLPPRTEVEGAARAFYELLTARNTELPDETPVARQRRVAAADAALDAAARALSAMLLGPIADQLGARRLLIVADGALQYVPFAALPDPAPGGAADDPLILRHEVVLSPSASAVAVLRSERRDTARAAKKVAIIADPVFSADDPRVTRQAAGRTAAARQAAAPPVTAAGDVLRSGADLGISSFRRLRFSREEAQTIASLTQAHERLQAVGFDASRATALTTDLTQFGIVHFSTHGLLNNTHPELSGLVLSLYDPRGQPQDGFLRLHDIYTLRLNADLVVLSACETALGREIRGEGLIGLARGFMYAGASRVVASLWNVEDQATAALMKEFYQGMLARGQSPAAALRAAQLSLWRGKRWRTPYYWGAFVLQGEWR